MRWDGKNLDSTDHKSHVAYATGLDGGSCPEGWQKMVKIFYEAFYSVAQFDDEWDGDQHPFVLANGDRTGFGFHGDFLNGWDHDVLSTSAPTKKYFNAGECAPLTASFSDKAPERRCTTQPEIVEDIMMVSKLPGNNPVDDEIVSSSQSSTLNSTSSSGSATRSSVTRSRTPVPVKDESSVAGESDQNSPTPTRADTSCKAKKTAARRS